MKLNTKIQLMSALIIALFITSSIYIYSQNQGSYVSSRQTSYRDRLIDYADILTYEVVPNTKDTMLYTRKVNSIWFGIWGGPNFNLSLGSLYTKIDPNNPNNIFNQLVDFYNKFGTGYSIGVMGEWCPPTSDISAGLKVAVFDKKSSRVSSDDRVGYFEREYDFDATLSYLILSPYVKYTFPFFDGFFVDAGADIAIVYNTVAYLEANFQNSGDIYHKMDLDDINGKTRFLFSIGVGYDFFIADFFATKNRVRVTPYADFKAGTNIITDNGSNWNDISLSVGLQFKLAPDRVFVDTLPYNPASEITPEYFASLKTDEGIEYPGFKTSLAEPPAFDLAMIAVPEPPIIAELPDIEPEEPDIINNNTPTPSIGGTPTPAVNIALNRTRVIGTFANSTSTSLTNQMKTILDDYADYMKEHPNVVCRIAGHSDDRGTYQQNYDRSKARADAAMNYLMSKGIPRSRIYSDARGSVAPVAVNDTEAGRRRNRRVEIVLQPR